MNFGLSRNVLNGLGEFGGCHVEQCESGSPHLSKLCEWAMGRERVPARLVGARRLPRRPVSDADEPAIGHRGDHEIRGRAGAPGLTPMRLTKAVARLFERERVCRVLLDEMRRSLAVDAECFAPDLGDENVMVS